jgi:hypothetical protein
VITNRLITVFKLNVNRIIHNRAIQPYSKLFFIFPVLNIFQRNIFIFRLVDKTHFYAIHVPVNVVVGVFMFLRLNIFLLFFSLDKLYVLLFH